jgi:hypothetical protein
MIGGCLDRRRDFARRDVPRRQVADVVHDQRHPRRIAAQQFLREVALNNRFDDGGLEYGPCGEDQQRRDAAPERDEIAVIMRPGVKTARRAAGAGQGAGAAEVKAGDRKGDQRAKHECKRHDLDPSRHFGVLFIDQIKIQKRMG